MPLLLIIYAKMVNNELLIKK